jgi:hypothetical protein
LHHAILGVGAGCLLVLFVRDAEEDDGLQSCGGGERGLSGHFVLRKLRDARHAFDRTPGADLFAYEEGKDKIVRAQTRLTDKVAQSCAPPQTARSMNQFPHAPRLRVRHPRSKLSARRSFHEWLYEVAGRCLLRPLCRDSCLTRRRYISLSTLAIHLQNWCSLLPQIVKAERIETND